MSGEDDLLGFGIEVHRDGDTLRGLENGQLRPDDEIRQGLVLGSRAGIVYPIWESIAIMLSNADADERMAEILDETRSCVPRRWRTVVDARLRALDEVGETEIGRWNRAEMRYYDAGASSAEARRSLLAEHASVPNWRVFLPRAGEILEPMGHEIDGRAVLEAGCGTCRTVRWLLRPREHRCRFVGLDISLDRLRVAKQMLPEADFVQGSGGALPFRDGRFGGVLLFGALHHLPDQAAAVADCARVLDGRGTLGIHEPVPKPKLIESWSRLRGALQRYEHSERDLEVEPAQLRAWLATHGFRIRAWRNLISPARTLVDAVVARWLPKLARSRFIAVAIDRIDQAFLRTVGRTSAQLGPHAVAVLARRGEPARDPGRRARLRGATGGPARSVEG